MLPRETVLYGVGKIFHLEIITVTVSEITFFPTQISYTPIQQVSQEIPCPLHRSRHAVPICRALEDQVFTKLASVAHCLFAIITSRSMMINPLGGSVTFDVEIDDFDGWEEFPVGELEERRRELNIPELDVDEVRAFNNASLGTYRQAINLMLIFL